ncbi:MAG: ZIP family metal transporter [Myxococcaceae bacterium]
MVSPAVQLAAFSTVIVVGTIAGAAIPMWTRSSVRLIGFLAFAAGVMFGAAFFHMLPEAYHGGGYTAFSFVPAGFLFLFLLERYVLVHVCEEPPECQEHSHNPARGLSAFLGLSIHTLFDGIALGSAIAGGVGFTVFIAVTAHKIPSSLSLAAILKMEGKPARTILGYATVFGLMVPAGALIYFALQSGIRTETFAPLALAFSAGSFLYIAVSDLLPNVSRHGRENRFRHVFALLAGMGVMFALQFVLPDHGH